MTTELTPVDPRNRSKTTVLSKPESITPQPLASKSSSQSTQSATATTVLNGTEKTESLLFSQSLKHSKEPLHELLGKRKNIKYCPYRDSTCPYGDKCRYNHTNDSISRVYYPTFIKKLKTISDSNLLSNTSTLNVFNTSLALNILPANNIMDYLKYQSTSSECWKPNIIPRYYIDKDKFLSEYDGKSVDEIVRSSKSINGLIDEEKITPSLSVVHDIHFNKIFGALPGVTTSGSKA